ncbi:MAG TPA: hypothetical protein VMG10_19435 [Gemmataceae bacterium]|nr:hypothetical protein [Gemmataceae bacterium]
MSALGKLPDPVVAASATFTGWTRRPGERWQAVVTAASEDACWRELRRHIEQLGAKYIDTFVAVASVDPNAKPKRRRF